MTYNQIIQELRTILESHAMINSVKFATPVEWINYESNPILPIALFSISNGIYDGSYQNTFNITIWVLDKSGHENQFETEVISDMHSIGRDIVNAVTLPSRKYSVEMPIQWDALSEKYEDFLSGVSFTLRIQTTGQNTYCDFPTN